MRLGLWSEYSGRDIKLKTSIETKRMSLKELYTSWNLFLFIRPSDFYLRKHTVVHMILYVYSDSDSPNYKRLWEYYNES